MKESKKVYDSIPYIPVILGVFFTIVWLADYFYLEPPLKWLGFVLAVPSYPICFLAHKKYVIDNQFFVVKAMGKSQKYKIEKLTEYSLESKTKLLLYFNHNEKEIHSFDAAAILDELLKVKSTIDSNKN